MERSTIEVRAYTSKQLACLYDVSTNTLGKWLKKHEYAIGKKIGHFYTIKQVTIIFEKLGYPFAFNLEDHKDIEP
jgi:hypothetical protein